MEYSDVIAFMRKHKDLIQNNEFNKLFGAFPEPHAGRDLLDLMWGKGDIIGNLKEEVPAYFANGSTKISSVVLPRYEDFTLIGPFAFSESSITNVYIPENILIIGEGAFSLCEKLQEVTLFPSLTTIEGMAFASCDNLKIIFKGSVEEWNKVDNDAEDLPFNRPYKLEGNFDVEQLLIPGTIHRVKSYKFAHVSNIKQLITHCRTIGEGAFTCCSHLEAVAIHSRTIGDYAFEGCENLKQVTLGIGVTLIKDFAFSQCSSLRNIVYEGTMEEFYNIKISSSWLDNCPKIKIECEDGIIVVNE